MDRIYVEVASIYVCRAEGQAVPSKKTISSNPMKELPATCEISPALVMFIEEVFERRTRRSFRVPLTRGSEQKFDCELAGARAADLIERVQCAEPLVAFV